ncbi:MAG TPA: amino acid permease [Pseudonocardiaceae bacterium]|nr:amino acid permease [Pseudonocardiaceae bacterium]
MGASGLARRLGTGDAVLIGLGSMIGAGVFAVFAPAAAAAGSWLLVGLALAVVVAYCNATCSAQLAARYPESGGTYVYGQRRLGPFWGYLAGWAFVVGKTASCAAMALTFAAYVAPGAERVSAVAAVAALTALNWRGMHRSALATRVIVAVVLVVLVVVGLAGLSGAGGRPGQVLPAGPPPLLGLLQSAGLLFFAFAGYARIATLGEEVRDPARTIPRAIPLALVITLLVYAWVAVAALLVLGPGRLAAAPAPLVQTVIEAGTGWLVPLVGVGAALACLGALLALILGVSRTTLAMARDGHLPGWLAAVHPRYRVPHRAELAVGVVVALLAASTDLRGAIGFSAFGVLVYYAIANAAALTLPRAEGRPPLLVGVLGLAGCLILAATLPPAAVLTGAAVLLVGTLWYAIGLARTP